MTPPSRSSFSFRPGWNESPFLFLTCITAVVPVEEVFFFHLHSFPPQWSFPLRPHFFYAPPYTPRNSRGSNAPFPLSIPTWNLRQGQSPILLPSRPFYPPFPPLRQRNKKRSFPSPVAAYENVSFFPQCVYPPSPLRFQGSPNVAHFITPLPSQNSAGVMDRAFSIFRNLDSFSILVSPYLDSFFVFFFLRFGPTFNPDCTPAKLFSGLLTSPFCPLAADGVFLLRFQKSAFAFLPLLFLGLSNWSPLPAS